MKKIKFEITFTPYTIDTYDTFTITEAEDIIMDDLGVDYYAIEWTHDNEGFIQDLAKSWCELMNNNILDDVIKSIELDGKAYSPKYYNYTTDNCQVFITYNEVKLDEYIAKNIADYEKNKIRSCDGFMFLGDETDAKIHYYLKNESVKLYSINDYLMDQYENVQSYEYIQGELIVKSI